MNLIIEKIKGYPFSVGNKIVLTYLSLLLAMLVSAEMTIWNTNISSMEAFGLNDQIAFKLLIVSMFYGSLLGWLSLIFMFLKQNPIWVNILAFLQMFFVVLLSIYGKVSPLLDIGTGAISIGTISIIFYLLFFIPKLVKDKELQEKLQNEVGRNL